MHLPTDSIPPELKADALETRGTQWGDIAVRYLDLPPGVDFTPLLKGLPHDQCQSPHWGYVLRGSIHLRYANGDEELAQAGEVFYWPAGHRLDRGRHHLPRVQPSQRDQARPGTRPSTDGRMRRLLREALTAVLQRRPGAPARAPCTVSALRDRWPGTVRRPGSRPPAW
jgi:hypothetical protein